MLVSSPLSTLAPAVVFSSDEAKSGMPSAVAVDFDALMQAHLTRVFNERDSDRRLSALADLYMEDATLFEPHAAVIGYEAISRAVDALQAGRPIRRNLRQSTSQ